MESLLFIIGVVGNVTSLLIFLSPMTTFWRIMKNKSTEDFEPVPYVVTLLGCSLWVYYGITKPGEYLVATVNGVGIIFEAIYVVIFLIYATPPLRVKTSIMVVVLDGAILGAVVLATQLVAEEGLRIMIIGVICACLNIFMYGSPLTIMKTVITTRSVEYMPFFLSFFLFVNGGIWTVYAIIDSDFFLGIPNGIGFIFGAIQLTLYMIYMNTKVSKQYLEESPRQRLLNEQEEDVEEGRPT
nr:bidirectional sugar transporter SWEET17 [Hemerocallis fulva]